MKMIKIFLILCMFLLLVGIVSAERYVDYGFREDVIASNGEVTYTNTPVTDVNAIGFVCTDKYCNSVREIPLWGGSVINSGDSDSMQLTYPTTLQDEYGYAIFYYKEGYIPWVQNPGWYGTCATGNELGCEGIADPRGPYAIYQGKKENCSAPIINFDIINDVQPNVPLVIDIEASLDATTYSAFHLSGPVGYQPPTLVAEGYYAAQTRVTLTITKANNQVFKETKIISIPASNSARIQFTWTPEEEGDYKAVIKTYVIDNKCILSQEWSDDALFTVIEEDPRNMCYTILNSADISDTTPTTGETITITANKISNYADDIYRLFPVRTRVTLSIVERASGNIVYTDNKLYEKNPNAKDYAGVSFDWTIPNVAGWYDTAMYAIGEDIMCINSRPNLDMTQKTPIEVGIKPNTAPTLTGIPDLTTDENTALPGNAIDLWQYASDSETSDEDMQFTLVSQSNSGLISCRISGERYVQCTTPAYNTYGYSDIKIEVNDGEFWDMDTFRVTVNRVNDYPIISNIPNVRMEVGDSVSLDLDHYTHDPDNTNDELTWSWTGDNNIEVEFDSVKHIVTFTGARHWDGEERITFTVTDPDGLSDTDICIVYVVVPEPENDDIIIARIRNTDYLLPGNMLMLNMALESNTYMDLEDLQITAVIQELGIKSATRHFELEGREETAKTIYMEIPEWAAPGYYDIRITISNNELRRVIHRDVKVI